MSSRRTSRPSGSAISSPGSAAGPSPSSSPDGPPVFLSGQAPAHASRSPSRGKLEEWATSGTYGPLFIGSSPSAVLQSSLENRLRARTDVSGSPEYALTWSGWDMPSGPPICALRGKARRTSANACTGWPTPRTPTGGPESAKRKKELGRTKSGGGDLQAAALTASAGWATPAARDYRHPNLKSYSERGGGTKGEQLPNQVRHQLAGWNTPRATDGSNGGPNQAGGALPADAVRASGAMPESSNAPTESAGGSLLNPRFSLWLQGYPDEWASFGARATPSSRRSRRPS
jgi:hypothetical protein